MPGIKAKYEPFRRTMRDLFDHAFELKFGKKPKGKATTELKDKFIGDILSCRKTYVKSIFAKSKEFSMQIYRLERFIYYMNQMQGRFDEAHKKLYADWMIGYEGRLELFKQNENRKRPTKRTANKKQKVEAEPVDETDTVEEINNETEPEESERYMYPDPPPPPPPPPSFRPPSDELLEDLDLTIKGELENSYLILEKAYLRYQDISSIGKYNNIEDYHEWLTDRVIEDLCGDYYLYYQPVHYPGLGSFFAIEQANLNIDLMGTTRGLLFTIALNEGKKPVILQGEYTYTGNGRISVEFKQEEKLGKTPFKFMQRIYLVFDICRYHLFPSKYNLDIIFGKMGQEKKGLIRKTSKGMSSVIIMSKRAVESQYHETRSFLSGFFRSRS